MSSVKPFPLPFRSLRVITGEGDSPFIVGTMYTAGYSDKAAKLAASCERLSLPYALHEVPTVHSSISRRGSDDLSFTKANFIYHLLRTHKKPILYLDSDCEFVSQPDLIAELAQSNCDFAVYNWLADEYEDRFAPIELTLEGPPPTKKRLYRNEGGMEFHSTTQLYCSGCVQYYANSLAARALLSRWHQTVAAFPGCFDDHCLDFAHNNITRRSWLYWLLKARWLPKAYARVCVWICTEPVINHPDLPAATRSIPIQDPRGRKRAYWNLMGRKTGAKIFPKGCVIDADAGLIYHVVDGRLIPMGKTDQKFWV